MRANECKRTVLPGLRSVPVYQTGTHAPSSDAPRRCSRACVSLPRRQAAAARPRRVSLSEQYEKLIVDCEPEEQRNVSGTVTASGCHRREENENRGFVLSRRSGNTTKGEWRLTFMAPALFLPTLYFFINGMLTCRDQRRRLFLVPFAL